MPAPTPKQRAALARVRGLTAVALITPQLVLIALVGTRLGLWGLETGWDFMTWQVGAVMAGVGVTAATMAVVFALGDLKRRGVMALVAAVVAGATATVYAVQHQRLTDAPRDVSTDLAEPPQPSQPLRDIRSRADAAPVGAPAACSRAVAAPTQVAPQTAVVALERAGFRVVGNAPFRVEGERRGFWYGFGHDAVIRIRPGRTDVRVIARDDRAQGEEACRLAAAILDRLTPQTRR